MGSKGPMRLLREGGLSSENRGMFSHGDMGFPLKVELRRAAILLLAKITA